MRLRILKSFGDKLNDQVGYIAQDKPGAARKFKSDILKRIKEIITVFGFTKYKNDPFDK